MANHRKRRPKSRAQLQPPKRTFKTGDIVNGLNKGRTLPLISRKPKKKPRGRLI